MGELDIRLLLRQLRLNPEGTESMERDLVKWFIAWHKAGRHLETGAGKAGRLRIVGGDLEGS